MKARQAKRPEAFIHTAFRPGTMGVFVLLIIILSFTAGAIRREMVLTLTGAIFLAIWIYCLLMTLLLALFHCRRAGRVSIRLSPQKVVAGGWTQVTYLEGNEIPFNKKIFQLPGILVRCRILLNTKDGRRIVYEFKPEPSAAAAQEMFQAEKRGAYSSAYHEFSCFDILGFFRFTYRIPPGDNPQLLVSPYAASEPVPVRARGGETIRQDAPPTERTDELIAHRPYLPGDDPRRINWKLYSHSSQLFIRQGEHEPPPLSNLTILIDTQFDSLYAGRVVPWAARWTSLRAAKAVDLLCENALAIVNSAGKDRNVQIGFTGQTEITGSSPAAMQTAAELGFSLAYPAAMSVPISALPPVPEDRAVLILALPRADAGPTALEMFLSNNANRSIELLFIYGGEVNLHEFRQAAEICVALYNKRPGIRARAVEIPGVQ